MNHSNLSILEGLTTLIGSHLTRQPTASPVLTKWWKSELMLATNFGSLCPKVTKAGSQNFGYQIWYCTRLLTKDCTTMVQVMAWCLMAPCQATSWNNVNQLLWCHKCCHCRIPLQMMCKKCTCYQFVTQTTVKSLTGFPQTSLEKF